KGGDNAGIGLAANRRHWRVAGTTVQGALSPPFAGGERPVRRRRIRRAGGTMKGQRTPGSCRRQRAPGRKAKSTSWRSQVLDFARGGNSIQEISIQTITSSPPPPRRHQYLRAHSVDVADHVVVPEPEHLEAACAEMRVAPRVPLRFRMLPAIHLNDQLRAKADEVENVAVERSEEHTSELQSR